MSSYVRRRKNLVRPRFQLKVGALFVASMMVALVSYAILMFGDIALLFDPHTTDVALVKSHLWDIMLLKGLMVLVLCGVLTMALATLVTFRVVGPIWRMSRFLEEIKKGESPSDCRLRRGDELHDFCALLNEVTAPLRRGEAEDAAPTASRRETETSALDA